MMNNLAARFGSPRLKRWLLALLVAVLGLGLVLWLARPGVLKQVLEQQLPAQTGRQFSVGQVTINPLTLGVRVSQVQLMEADGRSIALSADELQLRVSWKSLFYLAPILNELKLIHPQVHVVRTRNNGREESNFSDILTRFANQPARKGEPLRWSVSNIEVSDGTVVWDDRVAGKQMHVEAIRLGLPFLSNFPTALDIFVEPYLAARIDGSLFELKGRSKPFSTSLDTNVALDIEGFKLTEIQPFVAAVLPFRIASGRLSSHLVLNFSTPQGKPKMSLSGELGLSNLALNDRQGAALLSGKQIDASLKEVDLVSEHIVLSKLIVLEPQIWAGLDTHVQLNWLALNQSTQNAKVLPASTTPVSAAGKLMLELSHLQIKNGTLHWSDAANAKPALALDFTHIGLDVQQLSTAPKAAPARLRLTFEGEPGLNFAGTVSAAPVEVAGQLSVSALVLKNFQPYFNGVINGNITGTLGMQTAVDFREGNLNLKQLAISLDGLQVKGDAVQFGSLSVAKIGAQSVTVKPGERQFHITQLSIDQLRGDVFRDAQGQLNLSRLLKQAPTPAALPTGSPAVPGWQTVVDQLALTNSHLNLGDREVQPALQLSADGIDLQVDHWSSSFERPANIVLHTTVNQTGQFVVKGTVSPKAMLLDVDVKNFAVLPLQPYFTQLFNIAMQSGSISTTARLSWKDSGELAYQGNLKVAGLSTADKDSGEDFVRWDLLDIGGVDIRLNPAQRNITLGKVVLNKFYAKAVLSEKGRLNLKNILVTAPGSQSVPVSVSGVKATQTVPAVAAVPVVINVGDIVLGDGVINYTDNFIKPHYSMRMTGMQGQIGALHSTLAQAASINLSGKIDGEAPIVISGSLNPLINPMLLDIRMTASGVDLPTMTTYALKYAGYPIERGKLSLDVGYQLKDNQLKASNSLKIDELSFGEQVPGPDATALPVPLLVSLLTDSDGRISLDLPIEGTLDDPEFSIGGLLARVFLNLIGKVLTSPFTLLTHALEGLSGDSAEELATLAFAPGSDQLDETARTRLATLGAALQKRPAMKLDILGRADLATDQAGLRRYLLELELGLNPGPDATVAAIEPAERNRRIAKLYASASFAKPRNLLGLAKTLPPAEMEQLLLANIKIGDDDLQALALRRETLVQAYLSDVVHVPIERLFLVSPKLSGQDDDGQGVPSRVDFALKM